MYDLTEYIKKPEPNHQTLFGNPEPTEEYLQDWLVRTCEIIDRYRPKLLYFDWWIHRGICKPYLRKLAAYYYNRAAEWNAEVVINYKHDAFKGPTQIVEGQFSDGIKKNFTSEDFRFTTAKGYLYATALKCSENGNYCITSLGEQNASRQANFHGIIRDVTVLGTKEPCQWSRDEKGLHITSSLKSDYPVVFKICVD